MKTIQTKAKQISVALAALLAMSCLTAQATVLYKANNTTTLTNATSWTTVSGSANGVNVATAAPGSGDTATFDGTYAAGNNTAALSANSTWGTLSVSANIASSFNMTGANYLQLNSGITMADSCPYGFTIALGNNLIPASGSTWTIGSGDLLTISSVLAPAGNWTMVGSANAQSSGNYGTVFLTASSGSWGQTPSVGNGCILKVGNTGSFNGNPPVTTLSGGVLDLNGLSFSSGVSFSLNGSGNNGMGTVINSSATAASKSGGSWILTANATVGVFNGTIANSVNFTGAHVLTKVGPGLLSMGTGTGEGFNGLVINGGSVGWSANNAIPSITPVVNGGSLDLNASTYTTSFNLAGFGTSGMGALINSSSTAFSWNGGSGGIVLNGDAGMGGNGTGGMTLTMFNNITGTGALYKMGSCTLMLNGNATHQNTYSGATVVNGGTLILNYNGASGNMNNLVPNTPLCFGSNYLGAGVLQMNGKGSSTMAQTFTNTYLVSGAGVVSNILIGTHNTIALGNITRNTGGGTIDFYPTGSSALTNSTTTAVNSAGILGGWATVNNGADWAATPSQIAPYASYTTLAAGSGSGATLGNYTTSGGITLSANLVCNSLKNAGGILTMNGFNVTVGSGGAGGVLFGTTGNNAISGSGIISAGSGNELIVQVVGGQTATVPGADLLGVDTGTLTKSGAGTLSITTSSTPYTGVTTINQGTVLLGSGLAMGSSSIIVDGAATLSLGGVTTFSSQDLAGNGTISGALATMGMGGTIHPGGNGQWGTINFGTGLTEGSLSTNYFDLNAPNGSGPSDQIAVTGTLTCGGAKIVIVPGTGFTNGQYVLATATTAVSGTFNPTVTCTSGTGTYTLSYPTTTTVLLTVSGYASCTTPTAYSVTGGTNCSSTGVSVGLSSSDTIVTYGLFTNGVADGPGVVGTGAALAPTAWGNGTPLTIVGTYTVVGTNTIGGCTTVMNGQAVVTPAITTSYNLTGGTNGCSGSGGGLTMGLDGSQSGVTYQLLTNSVVITNVAGTGSAISFGLQTNTGTYTVTGTNTGCGFVAINGGTTNQVVIAATPGAPTISPATAGDGQVTVTWTAPSGTVSSYNVYRTAANGSSGSESLFTNVSGSPFVDNSVADGSQYFYYVTALNGTCESVHSTEVSATPNPVYTSYVITDAGSGNAQAGVSDSLTINAVSNGSPVSIGGPISIIFSGLANAPGGTAPTLGGTAFSAGSVTKTVTFGGGVGTTSLPLVAYNAGSGQTLTATDGTHSSTNTAGGGSSLSLTVSPAPSSAYRLTGIGSPTVASNYPVNVALVDQYANVETGTNASQNIAFSAGLSAGADGSAATVNGVAQGTAAAVSLVNGTNSVILVAHFPDAGKVLTVTNTTLTLASYGTGGTNLLLGTVTNAAANKLGMKTQPSATATVGVAFGTQPAVNILDLYSNTLTGSSLTVTSTASGGFILQGTTNVAAISGVATFSGLSLTNTGSITLTFSSGALTPVTSTAITVNGGAFVGLAWVTQPVATYGTNFTTPPVLAAVDQYGNPTTNGLVPSMNVTISMVGGGTLSGTTNYNLGSDGSNGLVTLNNLVITNGSGANHQLFATGTGSWPPVLGMAVWLDGSDPHYIAGTSTVTAWTNKASLINPFNTLVGAGGNIVSGSDTLNGRNVLLFPGNAGATTGRGLKGTTSNSGQAVTTFVVVKETVAQNTYQRICGFASGANDYDNVGSFDMNINGGNSRCERNSLDVSAGAVPAQGTAWLQEAIWNPTSNLQISTLIKSGAAASTASAAFNAQTFTYTFGVIGTGGAGGGGDDPWGGDIAEFIVFNSVLSTANQAAMETYLSNKWFNASAGAFTNGISAATASFTVTPATVTITSGVTANSKVYDGGTTATLAFGTIVLSNVVASDAGNVSLNSSSYTANFANAGPGTGIPVTVTGLTLTSGGANTNYTLVQPAGLSNDITAAVSYSGYAITDSGAGSATVGVADTLTITAVNSDTTTQTGLNGHVVLTFSGLNNGADGSAPTVTDYTGTPQPYGSTTLNFVNGVSTMGGALVPHVAQPSATLQVNDAASHSSTSPGGMNLSLSIAPAGISAYRLTGTGSPQVGVPYTVNVTMVDQYQNVITNGLSSVGLTFNPTPTLSPGADGSPATINGATQNTSASVSFTAGLGSVLLVAHTNDVSGKVISVTDGSKSSSSTGGTTLTLGAITPGAANMLSMKTQPSASATVGAAFAQQPAVNVLDLYSNLLTGSSATVTATASAGILQGGAATNQVPSSGVATFSGLSMTNTGTITLTFSSGSLTPVTSTAITVGAGAATQIIWAVQPGNVNSGVPFSPQPVLETADQYGNPTTNSLPASLAVAIGITNGGSCVLTGTTNWNLGSAYSNGVVTTTNLAVTGSGTPQLTIKAPPGYGTPPVAGAAIWLDASYAPSILLNGSGIVTNWLDRGGSNNNFAYSSATSIYYTNSNATFNGHKTVTFGGVTELFNTSYTNTSANVSVFVEFKETTGVNFDYMRPMATWAGNTADADYQNNGSFNYDTGAANNQARAVRNEGSNGDLNGPTVDWHTNYFDDEFFANTSSNALFVNGIFGASNTGGVGAFNIVATSVGGGINTGGAGNVNGQLNGDVAEMLVYSSALSTAQRQSVETYLYNKWNTTNYTYETAPPAAVSQPFTVANIVTPTFSVVSTNVIYGTASVTLTGTCNSGTNYPGAGDAISASINGFTVSGSFNDGTSGNFTINYNDPSLATNSVGNSPYAITYIYGGNGSTLNPATNNATALTINQAVPTATLAVNNSPVTYNASGQAATVSVTSSNTPGAVANTLTGGATTQTASGTYAVTANYVPTDNIDYATLSNLPAGSFTINQATSTATLAVNNPTVTYNGSGQSASVGITASNTPGTVSSVQYNGSATLPTNVNNYAVTASFVPTDTNYTTLTGLSAGSFTITPATPVLSVSNTPVFYNGLGQSAAVTSSVPGVVTNIVTGGQSSQTNAGTYSVAADFIPADTTDYVSLTNASAGNFVIQPAVPVLAVSNSPVPYNGSAYSAVVTSSVPGTVSGVLMAGQPSQTSAGTYAVTANFAPVDSVNYASLTNAPAGSFVIQQATPSVTFYLGTPGSTNVTVTYDASGHSAVSSIILWDDSPGGSYNTVLTGGAASQTNVGIYTVTLNWVPNDPNYLTLTGLAVGTYTIQPATTVITAAPTASAITNGQTLASSMLTGGSATPSGGTFAFTTPSTAPPVGTNSESVTYTYSDTNYATATTNVSVIVYSSAGCTGPAIVGGIAGTTNLCVGSPLMLTLTNVTGDAPLSYQWQTNNVAIASGTNSAYTNLSVAVPDSGNYVCVVTNACGAITSAVATVTVNPPPTVSVNSVTNCGTVSTILTATSSASSPLYSWSDGETTASITNASPAVTTNYTVTVTDGVTGCANSGGGGIVVNPLPTVSVNSVTNYGVMPATLTATTSAGSPIYLWSPGGATTPSITTSPTVTTNYTVTVTDGVTGCANSANGTITVYSVPTLSITGSGANVVVKWTNTAVGFNLEMATNLALPQVWGTNLTVPVVIGGQYTVTNPASGPVLFYRLSH